MRGSTWIIVARRLASILGRALTGAAIGAVLWSTVIWYSTRPEPGDRSVDPFLQLLPLALVFGGLFGCVPGLVWGLFVAMDAWVREPYSVVASRYEERQR